MNLEISDDFKKVLSEVQAMTDRRRQGHALFVEGGAGTGKSTLVNLLSERIKDAVVIAPTAVAATLTRGTTIHRLFHFPQKILEPARDRDKSFPSAVLRKAKALIVDEAGMVRADLVDGMDYYLRRANRRMAPFAGIPFIFVGDPYQLPPVLVNQDKEAFHALGYFSRHFFGAKVWQEYGLETINLKRVFRQKDTGFAELLSRVREGAPTDQDIELLNSRVGVSAPPHVVTYTPLRSRAEAINRSALALLPGKDEVFRAKIDGDFDPNALIAEQTLVLRRGALIMMLNNTPAWCNGMSGIYEGHHRGKLIVKLNSGERVEVGPHTWERFRYRWDSDKNRIAQEKLGTMEQYPVKVAWAVTIHKGQGQTLDQCKVDFGNGMFESGQAYVALSRVRTLGGLYLSRPLTRRDLQVDSDVKEFFDNGCRPKRVSDQEDQQDSLRKRQLSLFA